MMTLKELKNMVNAGANTKRVEQKSAFETEIAAYDVILGEIKASLKKVVLRNDARHTEMRQLQNKVSKFAVSDISIELAEEFLEKIYTYNVERLEIKWKYEDDIKKLIMGGEHQ